MEHNSGFVYPHQVENVLFAGVAGGFLDPFLGFGIIPAMISGVQAARAIATGRKYEDLIHQLKKDMQHVIVLRELFKNMDNDGYDRILGYLGIPGIKQLVYNTGIDMTRIVSAAAGHLNNISRRFKNH